MGVPRADQIITTRHVREFIQFPLARATYKPHYYGQDAQYLIVDSITVPETGTIGPVYVPDPQSTAGVYALVQKTIAAPGTLPKATITLLEKHGIVPRQLSRFGKFNLYEVVGTCQDPSDFLAGWTDFVMIYSGGVTETRTPSKRGDWKADTDLQDKIAGTFDNIYAIGALSLGEVDTPASQVLSIQYGSFRRDGTCGPFDDGTQVLYSLVSPNLGSGGGPAKVRYSLDGGKTWTDSAITGIGGSAVPDRVRKMGDFLLVTSSTEDAYYVTTLDPNTGIPGTTWTKVTTGITTGKGPTDIWVSNPREAYACGLGGYIYKIEDPLAGATVLNAGAATVVNLNRIDGQGNVIVAVGATQKVVLSGNFGQVWSMAPSLPGAANLTGVSVVAPSAYWVCNASGEAWYTQDGAATWTKQTAITGLTGAKDIRFATPEVGYIVGAGTGPLGVILATWDGGHSWAQMTKSPRLQNLLTVQGVNEITTPLVAQVDPEVAADNLALACLGDTGTTGATVIGSAPKE